MRLYNQTARRLSWDMAGRQFECDPWGSVDVPDELASSVERRGLPLKGTQMPPELKAHARAQHEKQAALDSEALRLKERALAAESALEGVRADLEAEKVKRAAAVTKTEKLEATIKGLSERLAEKDAEAKALAEKVREQAQAVADREVSAKKPAKK